MGWNEVGFSYSVLLSVSWKLRDVSSGVLGWWEGWGRSGGDRMLWMTTESTNEEQQKSMNDWFDPAHYVDVETHTCQDDTDS